MLPELGSAVPSADRRTETRGYAPGLLSSRSDWPPERVWPTRNGRSCIWTSRAPTASAARAHHCPTTTYGRSCASTPFRPDAAEQPRPALALADYGLHAAVKTAVACARAGVDHLAGLRARVVAERRKRTFFADFT